MFGQTMPAVLSECMQQAQAARVRIRNLWPSAAMWFRLQGLCLWWSLSGLPKVPGSQASLSTQRICQSLGSRYLWQRGCLSELAKGVPSPGHESEPVVWDLGALGGAR